MSPQQNLSTPAYNKKVIERFQQALARSMRGEHVELEQWFCEDAVWHLPHSTTRMIDSADLHGRATIVAMMREGVAQFYEPATIHFDCHHLTAEEDRVHLHFTMRARTSRGQHYENRYQTLFVLRGGRIAEAWEYLDTALLFSLFTDST